MWGFLILNFFVFRPTLVTISIHSLTFLGEISEIVEDMDAGDVIFGTRARNSHAEKKETFILEIIMKIQ